MLSCFPRGVLDEILYLIESVSEDFPSHSFIPENRIRIPVLAKVHVLLDKMFCSSISIVIY